MMRIGDEVSTRRGTGRIKYIGSDLAIVEVDGVDVAAHVCELGEPEPPGAHRPLTLDDAVEARMREPFRCRRCGAYGLRAPSGDCCATFCWRERRLMRDRACAKIRAELLAGC